VADIYIMAHGHTATTDPAVTASSVLYGSGVTIVLNEVTVSYLLLDVAAWGDIDGAYDEDSEAPSTYNTGKPVGNALMNPGWVGIMDLAIQNVVVNGIVSIDVGSWNTALVNHPTTDAGVLNFESLVPTFDDAFAYMGANGVGGDKIGKTFIFIGLKDILITMDKMYGVTALFTDVDGKPDTSAPQIMGDIYVGGMSMAIAPNPVTHTNSWFAVFAH